MDFYQINERLTKDDSLEIYPDFEVQRSKDLMIRGKGFYAIWDEEAGLWSTDEYDVQRLVDADLMKRKAEIEASSDRRVKVKLMRKHSSGLWQEFRRFMSNLSDNSKELDTNLTFSNTIVKKADHVSKRLPYPLQAGDISAYEELFGTLYEPEEKAKLEWALGAIISGDSKSIQKFLVLYGPGGGGKSTWLNLVMAMVDGYYTTFEAKSLTGNNNAFATEVFRNNPLVAIQHDGDLSKIEDNSKFNSLISHEDMTMNEKYKPSYTASIAAFMLMATNKPVKITDAKSGIIRRLIDVRPSGEKVSPRRYQALVSQLSFELGAIAHHCLEVYREMGRDFYSGYRPVEMMLQTDVFYNYMEQQFDIFKEQNGTTLNQAYDLYKAWCDESNVEYPLAKYKFREELRNYFGNFEERMRFENGERVRSWYSEFQTEMFTVQIEQEGPVSLSLDSDESILDDLYADQPAQYATDSGTPVKRWDDVTTTLWDLDTYKLHYVKPPENHIVIDFDLRGDDGEKDAELNLEAASKWPSTYAEYSKSGGGIHLHYVYDGEVGQLSSVYSEGIEVKVFTGNSSLRRQHSKSNNIPVAVISSGLPLKEKKVISEDRIKSEKGLRDLVTRNLNKEFHAGTKPSMDFIKKITDDAYESGLQYDISNMKPSIMAFANNSSNQAMACLKIFSQLKFTGKEDVDQTPDSGRDESNPFDPSDAKGRIVFFDVEVFPNLFVICWKYQGSDQMNRMINPKSLDVEFLMNRRLVGFNNRRYDNHILYAAFMGYSNKQLYELSQKIISNDKGALFGNAYNLSYADIYDFSSVKQGLKKFEIELGLKHLELGLPWDQPVPEDLWERVAEYCDNDVIATEAVFEARKQDWVARQILASLSGLSTNESTPKHTAKIIFGDDRNPQDKFIHTDLSERFPGYEFDPMKKTGKSSYRGEDPGEGGYVYSEPGMYENVALLDIASMHPSTIEIINLFGPYTEKFGDLKQARIAIKRKHYDEARTMFNGALVPYLHDEADAKALSNALKIAINIVYGLTAASFPNAFRPKDNNDNVVAKRGALFMIDLKHAVQEKGFTVAHIKTDSIKIPDATPEIIDFVMEFGAQYGYDFEHEATYKKMTLVNESTYVAQYDEMTRPFGADTDWTATGAQYQHPYVFKKLFTHEPIKFADMCEAKFVTSALYLDFTDGEKDTPIVLDTTNLRFIGKAGLFVPVLPGTGGGSLMREKDGKFHNANGATGYSWKEAHVVENLKLEDEVDETYFKKLTDAARDNLAKFGDVEWFLS